MIELSSELLRLRKFLIMLLDTHASVIDVPRDAPLRPRGAGQ